MKIGGIELNAVNAKEFRVTITPEMAEKLLKLNTKNRPITKPKLIRLKSQMEENEWLYNGETIIFSESDILLNGQHRLMACVNSQKPFDTIVVYGIEEATFPTHDAEPGRKAADVLAREGIVSAKSIAAAISVVNNYIRGVSISQRRNLSNMRVLGLHEKYPDLINSVRFIKRIGTRKIAPESLLVGFHYLFSRKEPELSDIFFESLLKGSNLMEGDPVYVLREKLLENMISQTKFKKQVMAALFIKAWNFMMDNKKIKVLRWVDRGPGAEPFPLIK